jgi:hypothetical protein
VYWEMGGNKYSSLRPQLGVTSNWGREQRKKARKATAQGQDLEDSPYQAKSTVINAAIRAQRATKTLPEGIGKFSKRVDTALPGKHTRVLYDTLQRREAKVLAQLRTGKARLNGHLHQIGATESDQCECGRAKETVEHFLFRCTKWETQRATMLDQTETRRGNLSFYLGGKASSDPDKWTPDMNAVKATVKYAITTGRLDPESEQETDPQRTPPT